MKDTINILCATDATYAKHVAVMLTSLFENNQNNNIHVFVFVDDIKSAVWTRYKSLAKKYNQVVEVIEIPKQVLIEHGAFEKWYFTIAMYYRILAADLLPRDIQKIIYLDGDICVTGDLLPFWKEDISNVAMAVIKDNNYTEDEPYSRVGYPKNKGYFNSGVLYMNLEYWRNNNTISKCLTHLKEYGENFIYVDQDLLNAVLIDEIKWVPLNYNFQTFYLKHENFVKHSIDIQNEIRQYHDIPLIVHFVGPTKPWNFKYRGMPYANIWLKYQLKSPWKFDFIFRPINIKFFSYFCKRCLWLIGLAKNKRGLAKEFQEL